MCGDWLDLKVNTILNSKIVYHCVNQGVQLPYIGK